MPVRALLLVSGIYDLAPIAECFLQAEIGLTDEEVAAWSPLGAEMRPGVQLTVTVGGDKTPPFVSQAAALAERNGLIVRTLPELNHMSVVRELGIPETKAARLLAGVVLV